MTDFVKRIDSILQEKNLKRAALCSELELSSTSITDWARRGTVPAGVEWLISGKESGLSNEKKWLLAQWGQLDPTQQDTVRTLLDKWEADRTAKEKKSLDA